MNTAHAPHAAHVTIGITPIHLIFVIQLNRYLQGVFYTMRPFQDLQRAVAAVP